MARRVSAALLAAVRDRVKAYWDSLADLSGGCQVEVMDDGQPPPRCGPLFAAVHDGGEKGIGRQADVVDVLQGVSVTLTMKYLAMPTDAAGRQLVVKDGTGLLERAAALRDLLHGDYKTLAAANGDLAAPAGFGWCEPLTFQARSVVAAKGPDWFWSDLQAKTSPPPPAGLAVTLAFHGARYTAPKDWAA